MNKTQIMINNKTPLQIITISNVILEPYFVSNLKEYLGDNLIVSNILFEEYLGIENQTKISSADLIVVWMNFEGLRSISNNFGFRPEQKPDEHLGLCKKLNDDLVRISGAKIIWFSFENYDVHLTEVIGHTYNSFLDRLNLALQDILDKSTSFIDLKHLVAEVGISNAYDTKGKYRWNAPYSKKLINVAVKEICKQYYIEKGITKKCLVLDCDNVLWGGILSENGMEELKLSSSGLGRVYQDFQRFVLSLHYHGVILAICSKNDLSDVLVIFRNHSEMILKEEHIACFQVNWVDKPSNIKGIAEKLNIGLDSMVFVDDSIVEIEAVKSMIPDVTAILFKRDMEYNQFSCFNPRNNISLSDIEKRNETYRTNEFREELKSEYIDYADYINALQIKTDIHKATPIEYSRISELTQRTNKCTNGKRYTVDKIKERVTSHEINLYSISVSDRFSDLGIVGAIEIEGDTLTLFSLSCRALGREIEKEMISFISENHPKANRVEFQSTGKNEDIKSILLNTFSIQPFKET